MTKQELICDFGKKVAYYRNENKWTQNDLANMLETSSNTICNIEKGKNFVKPDMLIKLACVFNIEIYQLFTPDNIKYDDTADVLAKYSNKVKESVEKLKEDFVKKIKK
ncbi:MAG: helix-turn-helix domain-containing protein [Treponema sp.]|nr:helix-turn-helix domain-containing protein [Treponema sp.]